MSDTMGVVVTYLDGRVEQTTVNAVEFAKLVERVNIPDGILMIQFMPTYFIMQMRKTDASFRAAGSDGQAVGGQSGDLPPGRWYGVGGCSQAGDAGAQDGRENGAGSSGQPAATPVHPAEGPPADRIITLRGPNTPTFAEREFTATELAGSGLGRPGEVNQPATLPYTEWQPLPDIITVDSPMIERAINTAEQYINRMEEMGTPEDPLRKVMDVWHDTVIPTPVPGDFNNEGLRTWGNIGEPPAPPPEQPPEQMKPFVVRDLIGGDHPRFAEADYLTVSMEDFYPAPPGTRVLNVQPDGSWSERPVVYDTPNPENPKPFDGSYGLRKTEIKFKADGPPNSGDKDKE